MDSAFFATFTLSIKLATLTTLLLIVIGIPVGYFLAYSKLKIKPVFQALVSMPLVLPPSVLGFYLLLLFSPTHWFGGFLEQNFDIRLAFSFSGILVGSVIFNLPFMVNSVQTGFNNLPVSLKEAAYTLGKSRLKTLFKVLIPNIKPALLTGICLTFAHTLGEFGVILMIGGNIPEETRVASIAVYDEVQALNFEVANQYAVWLLIFSFLILLLVYGINREYAKWRSF